MFRHYINLFQDSVKYAGALNPTTLYWIIKLSYCTQWSWPLLWQLLSIVWFRTNGSQYNPTFCINLQNHDWVHFGNGCGLSNSEPPLEETRLPPEEAIIRIMAAIHQIKFWYANTSSEISLDKKAQAETSNPLNCLLLIHPWGMRWLIHWSSKYLQSLGSKPHNIFFY